MEFIHQINASIKTYIRGIALPGEKPLFTVTPMMVVSATVVTLVFDLAATQLIWSSQRAWLYPLFVPLFALGQAALWYLYMEEHQAVHGAVSKLAWLNTLVAYLGSIVSLGSPPSLYRVKHLLQHHPLWLLATIGDPDFRWLQRLGFVEGQAMDHYWSLLLRLLLSPSFYLKNLVSRVRVHMIQAPLAHRFLVLMWWALLIVAAATFHRWAALLMYLLLLTVAFPISTLLHTATEHVWASKEHPRLKTHPRLLPIDSNPHMFLVYLYWRMAILSTDLSQHQLHHHRPINHEWPMVAYSDKAQADLPNAVWGIRNHFQASFAYLVQAPPAV